jgi:hypothetical protein
MFWRNMSPSSSALKSWATFNPKMLDDTALCPRRQNYLQPLLWQRQIINNGLIWQTTSLAILPSDTTFLSEIMFKRVTILITVGSSIMDNLLSYYACSHRSFTKLVFPAVWNKCMIFMFPRRVYNECCMSNCTIRDSRGASAVWGPPLLCTYIQPVQRFQVTRSFWWNVVKGQFSVEATLAYFYNFLLSVIP